MLKPYLFIEKTADRGRGVYTRERIPAGTVIEVSPVIVMEQKDRPMLDQTLLHDYIFEWGKNKDQCCMALGIILKIHKILAIAFVIVVIHGF